MKSELRDQFLKRRNELSSAEIAELSEEICERVVNLPQFSECDTIFAYQSFGSEVDTTLLIEHAWNAGKAVCIPRIVAKGEMDFRVIEHGQPLELNAYGILEPSEKSELVIPNERSMFIVPGIAFDKRGFRIGYGAGFYDVYFAKFENSVKSAAKVGVCFDFCVVENAFPDAHDVPMSMIVTN